MKSCLHLPHQSINSPLSQAYNELMKPVPFYRAFSRENTKINGSQKTLTRLLGNGEEKIRRDQSRKIGVERSRTVLGKYGLQESTH